MRTRKPQTLVDVQGLIEEHLYALAELQGELEFIYAERSGAFDPDKESDKFDAIEQLEEACGLIENSGAHLESAVVVLEQARDVLDDCAEAAEGGAA